MCLAGLVLAGCSGGSSGGGGGSATSMDGTWDFVASGALERYRDGTAIVAGGSATLTFDTTFEDPGYCSYRRRLTVSVNQSGSATATAGVTLSEDATGDYCYPASEGPRVGFTATRTAGGTGFGSWSGTWQITSPEFSPGATCTVQLNGQRATGTCSPGTGRFEGSFELTLGSGALSGTGTSPGGNVIQIAASRR
jgi:hypothetical protein